MLIKVSILVVALIGIAAAGTLQNLFPSGTFSRYYGKTPFIYLIPVAPATDAPTTAAPVTPAPVTPAPVTPAPVTPAPAVTPNQQLTNKLITAAQNAAVTAGYSLQSTWVSTICLSSSRGVKTWRGMRGTPSTNQCVFCFCSETISMTASAASIANCRFTGCDGASAPAIATWTNISSATPWVSLGAALDYQLYQVPSGYCFLEPYDAPSASRNMHCYETNP